MKIIKKALKTIIWTIGAFFVGVLIPAPSHDILNWGIPCLFALVALALCIKGKLPWTDMEKIIVPQRKKTPWYLWKFSFGSIFLLYIMGSMTYAMIKNMEFNIIYILLDILFLSIVMLLAISVWEDRKDIDFRSNIES